MHKFYYSEKQKQTLFELYPPCDHLNYIEIDGKEYEYTECCETHESSKWDDAVYIGEADDSKIIVTHISALEWKRLNRRGGSQ